ncbi:MAG: methylcrotonoyl-CoA carboxylase, partial [Alphaproteobacteria bacterium]|nr:methylcrotonoyl-CoA carboxylase [Alphaproteobacteria bacterium]
AMTPQEEAAFKAPTLEQFTRQSSAYYSTARLWDDGIIAPHQTRDVLGLALAVCGNKAVEDGRFGVFRM